MSKKDLLPCPFCGSTPRTGGDFGNFYVACDNIYSEHCCPAGPSVRANTVQEACDKWNTRKGENKCTLKN